MPAPASVTTNQSLKRSTHGSTGCLSSNQGNKTQESAQ